MGAQGWDRGAGGGVPGANPGAAGGPPVGRGGPGASQRRTIWIVLGVFGLGTLLMLSALGLLAAFGFHRYRERAAAAESARRELELRVTPSSSADATQDLVDRDFQFKLAWPGAGFKLLHEADAKKLLPDATAALMGQDGCAGVVIVEHLPGAELEAMAHTLIDNMPLSDKRTLTFEHGRYFDRDAVYYVVEGRIQGTPARYHDVVMVREEHLYQVMAMARVELASSCFATLQRSFSMLDGKVTGRETARESLTLETAGVRLRAERFESAVHRLALEAPAGTRLVAGEDLTRLDPNGAVGVEAGNVYVVVGAERALGVDHAAYARALVSTTAQSVGAAAEAKPLDKRIAGSPVALHRIPGPASFENLYGVWFDGDLQLYVRAWYPASLRSKAEPIVDQVLGAVRVLSVGDAEALGRQLPTTSSAMSVGQHDALRNGVLTDFERGFRLSVPAGPWLLSTNAPGHGIPGNPALLLYRPDLGLSVALYRELGTGDELGTVRALVGQLSSQQPDAIRLDPQPASVPGAARVTHDFIDNHGAPGRYEIYTMGRGHDRVELVAWGLRSNLEQAAPELERLARGLRFEPGPIQELDTGPRGVKDYRLGYALALPGEGWSARPSPGNVPNPGSSLVDASSSRGSVAVVAVQGAVGNEEWFLGVIEQLVAARVAQAESAAPARSDATLGGLPARRLVWRRGVEAMMAIRGTTYYGVFVVSERTVGGLEPQAVFDGFSLLP